MAKIIWDRRCLLCGSSPVRMWTIDSLSKVAVSYLCDEHSAPLLAIIQAAGDFPPDQQQPLPDRIPPDEEVAHTRGRREPVMEPLNWTPPE